MKAAPPRISTLLLVGGLGTRLRSVAPDLPKALVPVAGRPFLEWILEKLLGARFNQSVLCTGYRSELIEKHFGDHFHALKLIYSRESRPLGTAGALRLAAPRLEGEFVLVLNGDSFCDVEISAFCEAHLKSGAQASMALVHVPDTSRFGRVDCSPGGRVVSLNEKTGVVEPGWINAGIYLLPKSWLLEIPSDQEVSLEREIFPLWLSHGIRGVKEFARFLDIGTPESLAEGEVFFASLNPRHDSRSVFLESSNAAHDH